VDRPPSKFPPKLLPYTRCSIISSRIATNDSGKDVLCFIVSITLRAPDSSRTYSWNIAKLFDAFLALDSTIRTSIGGRKEVKAAGIVTLPDGKSWKDFAPSKIDQRKATLEAYLESLLTAPLQDKTDICEFLITDVASSSGGTANSTSEGGIKSGYLTKRGKAFGG
jgi:RalA-binding protein 1